MRRPALLVVAAGAAALSTAAVATATPGLPPGTDLIRTLSASGPTFSLKASVTSENVGDKGDGTFSFVYGSGAKVWATASCITVSGGTGTISGVITAATGIGPLGGSGKPGTYVTISFKDQPGTAKDLLSAPVYSTKPGSCGTTLPLKIEVPRYSLTVKDGWTPPAHPPCHTPTPTASPTPLPTATPTPTVTPTPTPTPTPTVTPTPTPTPTITPTPEPTPTPTPVETEPPIIT